MQLQVDSSLRTSSDKTLELGQVLMAVENLLQRCTSKQHGANLKHVETNVAEEEHKVLHGGVADEVTKKGRQAQVCPTTNKQQQ